MSVYAAPTSGVYHATRSCAPRGAGRTLASFAVQSGYEPCGVCQPREPDERPDCAPGNLDYQHRPRSADHISDVAFEDALDRGDTVQDVADILDVRPYAVLRGLAQRDMQDRVCPTQHDRADEQADANSAQEVSANGD